MTTVDREAALAAVRIVAEHAARTAHTAPFADRLRAQVDFLDRTEARIVVAGEAKRGKSALVKALLGRAVVPVDTAVCTATHVVVSYAAVVSATAIDEEGTAHDIPSDEVARWVTRDGVRAVRVWTPSPFLEEGVELVDTPGVGGLVAAHAAVTLAALASADAVLLVLDLSTPITAPELEFLAEAAERIDTVLVALTHADLYPDDASAAIVDATRAAIAAKVPRLAGLPLARVSSTLYGALADGDPLDESGIPGLAATLRALVVERAADARLANVLRHALAAARAVQWVGAFALNEAPDADKRAQLAAEEDRLRALIEGNTQWATTLSDRMRDVGFDADEMLMRQQGEIRRRYDQRLATFSKALRDSLPGELTTELEALAMEFGTFIDRAAATVAGDLAREHDLGDPALLHDGALGLVVEPGQVEKAKADLQQVWYLQMPMFTMERPISSLATVLHVGVTAAWLNPIAMIGGAVVGVVLMRKRLLTADQQRAKEVVRTTLADAVTELRRASQRRIDTLLRAIRDGMKAAYQLELTAVQAARVELQRLIEVDVADRDRIKNTIRKDLSEVRALQQTITAALADVSAMPVEVQHA